MIFHAFLVRVRYTKGVSWIATLHVKCEGETSLLVPGLPGPANMSWGTELWVSLLETTSFSTLTHLFLSFFIFRDTTRVCIRRQRSTVHVVKYRMLIRCFRQRVTRIPPKTSSQWQTTHESFAFAVASRGRRSSLLWCIPSFLVILDPGLLIVVLRFLSHDIFDEYWYDDI